MLYLNLHIDLPSEPILRDRTLRDWLGGLIGREVELRTGEDLATVTGLSVFKPVTAALSEAGIDDVLSVIVDGKTAYVDTDENSGDLATAVAELDARAALDEGFTTMRMALSRRAEGLHVLVEVMIQRRVPSDSPELTVRVAGRLDDMQIRPGETAPMYAARLRALLAAPDDLRDVHARFSALGGRLDQALRHHLGALCVSCTRSPTTTRLIRPGPRQVDHLRRLGWGRMVRMPKYRPVPITSRRGAYDEPFYHYYFDPYFDFVAWVLLTEAVAGRGLGGLAFEVVEPDGSLAFNATNAPGQAPVGGVYEGLASASAALTLTEDELVIDAAVPVFEGADPGELGDPRVTQGFGGEGLTSGSGGWNEGSNGVAGGDLGGSCGASCGGCGSG